MKLDWFDRLDRLNNGQQLIDLIGSGTASNCAMAQTLSGRLLETSFFVTFRAPFKICGSNNLTVPRFANPGTSEKRPSAVNLLYPRNGFRYVLFYKKKKLEKR